MDLLFERGKDQWKEMLNCYRDTRKRLARRPSMAVQALRKRCFPAGYFFNLVQMLHAGIDVLVLAARCHRKAAECCCTSAHKLKESHYSWALATVVNRVACAGARHTVAIRPVGGMHAPLPI